jgi:lipid II:glycine glycyltransferase (peptidoglycan interpeptide bridge formation enzyme)
MEDFCGDYDFLQSEEWRQFQEAAGRRTFLVSDKNFRASIIEHQLPIVGKYFYIPRGDISGAAEAIINLAKEEKASWIRIDTDYKNSDYKIVKAPHDMQPKEVFVIDIGKNEEQLLGEMKAKTRYNIRLAEKKGVMTRIVDRGSHNEKYFGEFLRLVKITAQRDGITPHPDEYYRKMFEIIPGDILKLYIAEFGGKIIAANLVIFYGGTTTYLHGASDNEFRNAMAPYLLQWRQIQEAKKVGCTRYDFGGVKTNGDSSWAGITKFKTGFSPATQPFEFSGSYDIVISSMKYNVYRIMQRIKSFL